MTNYNSGKINYAKILTSMPDGLSTILQLPLSKGVENGKKLCENMFHMNNIKIRVHGLDKIKNGPKVYISNHTTNLDFLILFYILGCGFLASSNINDNPITKSLTNIIPILMINRGEKTNTVEKMKEYVENNNTICLFVEGMMTNPNTLIKFRTGAFHIGHTIYPIVLKYKNNICDMDFGKFILKLFSEQTEEVDMYVLDPFYPPFDETKIELVRQAMAKTGNLLLSRVSNRDIVDS
jgi:1-acyl-sn-glycerol-3-phosphate acyltransferase